MTAPLHSLPIAPSSPSEASPPALARRPSQHWVFVLFVLPFALLAARHWSWDPPIGSGDYAQYLAHARAIVEGRPYTDIGYIYHPGAPMVGPTAYPPGLPLTLAPIVATVGIHSPWLRVLMLLSVLAFAYFAYRRLAMDIAPWQAAFAAGVAAFVAEARFGTLAPLSDVGFCALIWATILGVDHAMSWTWRRTALITALGFAAMAYRVPGVVLVPALGIYALASWKQNRGRALIPVAVWSLSGFAVIASRSIDVPFASFLVPQIPNLAGRLQSVLRVYSRAALDAQLYPFPNDSANDAYHVVASIAMICGSAALLWRLRRSMLATTTVTYIAMLIASPAMIGRYLWPLFPVLVAGIVLAVTAAFRALARRLRMPARGPAIAAGALSIVALGALWRELRAPVRASDAKVPERIALFDRLRATNEREPIRVVYANPRVLTLETRVPAMAFLFETPAKHLAALHERRITHLVWPTAMPTDCRGRLGHELPQIFPGRFSLEYGNAQYRLYRVVNTELPIPATDNYRPSWGGSLCNPSRLDLEDGSR